MLTEAGMTPHTDDRDEDAAKTAGGVQRVVEWLQTLKDIPVSENDMDAFNSCLSVAVDEKQPQTQSASDKREEVLADTGNFDIRDPIGQKFYEDHKAGTATHEAYRKCTGRESRKLFREAWAKAKYGKIVHAKQQLRSWQTVDATKGTYLTFGRVVEHLGGWGWKPAVAGAKALAGKCCKLGGKWVQTDTFSDLLLFFVLEKSVTDTFAQSWSLYTESISNSEVATGVRGKLVAAGVGTPSLVVSDMDAAGGAPIEPKLKKKGDDTVVRKKMAEANKRAAKVKTEYEKATSAATTFIANVRQCQRGFEWANNEQNVGSLELELAAVQGKVSPFGKEFLLTELSELKKRYKRDRLLDQLDIFGALAPDVRSLLKRTHSLTSMCSVSLAS